MILMYREISDFSASWLYFPWHSRWSISTNRGLQLFLLHLRPRANIFSSKGSTNTQSRSISFFKSWEELNYSYSRPIRKKILTSSIITVIVATLMMGAIELRVELGYIIFRGVNAVIILLKIQPLMSSISKFTHQYFMYNQRSRIIFAIEFIAL